jgi:hypothetical protein
MLQPFVVLRPEKGITDFLNKRLNTTQRRSEGGDT